MLANGTKFPIRILLAKEEYDALIDGLKGNENDFTGHIASNAKALREKIEKHGRIETDENGNEFIRLCFYEKEGEYFIWQFIAASTIAADYRELMEFVDTV